MLQRRTGGGSCFWWRSWAAFLVRNGHRWGVELAQLGRASQGLGVQVLAPCCGRLALLHDERMGDGGRVLADAGDLPGDFDIRDVRRDAEAVVLDLARDADQGEHRRVHDGELVAE